MRWSSTGAGGQAEAVTDSNGYYEIGDLGTGDGSVNLRLPPGTQPVVFNWPIRLDSGTDLHLNLGYYWGNNPPLPVVLAGNLENNRLAINIENRTAEIATGGTIEILSPGGIRVSPPIQAGQGKVASYDSHQFQFAVDELAAGGSTAVEVLLNKVQAAAQAGQADSTVRVIFTYDQQLTPQVIEVDLSTDAVTGPQASLDLSQDQPDTSAGLEVSPAPAAPPAIPAEPEAAAADTSPADQATPQPAGQVPLPVTGTGSKTAGIIELGLPMLVVLSLVVGGWWSLKSKR